MTQERQPEFRRFAEWFKEQYGYSPPYDPIFMSTYKNRPEYSAWVSLGRPSTAVSGGKVRGFASGVAEEFLAKKRRLEIEADDRTLPTQIEINGKLEDVTWEELADITDEFGSPLTLYVPILPAGILQSGMASQLFNQVRTFDINSGKFIPTDKEYLTATFELETGEAFSPKAVFNFTKLPSVEKDLVERGFDADLLEHPTVMNFLDEQMMFQRGERLDPAFLEGLGRIMKEVQTNPGNAEAILAKYAPRPQIQEAQWGQRGTPEQIAQWGQQTYQGQQALQTFWGLPKMETFGTEKEYQQNVINQLGKQAEDILASGVDLRNLNPLTSAQGQVVGQYQTSQKRLAELEGGAPESWNPQIAQEQETDRQRLEAEQIKKQKAKKSPLDIQFERLLEESRRPQRVTRL